MYVGPVVGVERCGLHDRSYGAIALLAIVGIITVVFPRGYLAGCVGSNARTGL